MYAQGLQTLILLSVPVLVITAFIAFVSHHRKATTVAIKIIGRKGLVAIATDPEGAVLVDGELWRAASRNPLATWTRIRVVGTDTHLLLVEPL